MRSNQKPEDRRQRTEDGRTKELKNRKLKIDEKIK
jgi:hypothetical protein